MHVYYKNVYFYLKVDGGTMLSIKVHWSQKLWYNDGQFCLNVPFSFPSYVVPVVKKLSKKEHILVNVNSGAGSETLCESSNHPLKVYLVCSDLFLLEENLKLPF